MSVYSAISIAHALAGTVALVTYWLSVTITKGSPLHRRSGQIYLSSMVALLALAVPMTGFYFAKGQIIVGSFLTYLLLITVNGVWLSWRSIKDKKNWPRYVGPVFQSLKWLMLLSGFGIATIGWVYGENMKVIMMRFSLIGILTFIGMHRGSRAEPTHPKWWLRQHINSMMGNGVATHIAFLSIGLPRLVPGIQGQWFQNIAWLGPILVAWMGSIYFARRYLKSRKPLMPAQPS